MRQPKETEMGYMRNNAIVITSEFSVRVETAHRKASDIFEWVSPISPATINGSRSFFIPPDGSKEGWGESNIGDECRREFIK